MCPSLPRFALSRPAGRRRRARRAISALLACMLLLAPSAD